MSFLKPKFVLLALVCGLLPVLVASGCSGGAFTADGAGTGATSSAGSSSTGGTPVLARG